MASSAAERRDERSGKSSRGHRFSSRLVIRIETSSSRVFKVVCTSAKRTSREELKVLNLVSRESSLVNLSAVEGH